MSSNVKINYSKLGDDIEALTNLYGELSNFKRTVENVNDALKQQSGVAISQLEDLGKEIIALCNAATKDVNAQCAILKIFQNTMRSIIHPVFEFSDVHVDAESVRTGILSARNLLDFMYFAHSISPTNEQYCQMIDGQLVYDELRMQQEQLNGEKIHEILDTVLPNSKKACGGKGRWLWI